MHAPVKGDPVKTAKKVKIAIWILIAAVIALFLYYNLPRTAVVQITGTDVKRIDKNSGKSVDPKTVDGGKGGAVQTHDVRFINSIARNGKPMVFRNEDTGWGWPPYLKFDSADVSAEAQGYASDPEKPWVLVKYYGWRIRIFSMFPNVIKFKVVDREYSHLPLFNILVVVVLAGLAFFIRSKFKAFLERLKGPKKKG
jgi:hypothetical protein